MCGSLLLILRQDSQREDDHVPPARILPDQLLELFVADIVLMRGGAVENTDHSAIHFRDEEILREGLDAKLDRFACRGFLWRKPGGLDRETSIQVFGQYMSDNGFVHLLNP